jgi:hypothetical protein
VLTKFLINLETVNVTFEEGWLHIEKVKEGEYSVNIMYSCMKMEH